MSEPIFKRFHFLTRITHSGRVFAAEEQQDSFVNPSDPQYPI
jgi:hypothetical protein